MCSSVAAVPVRPGMLGGDLESREEMQPEENMDVADRFEILADLGGGAYGTVYKAKDRGRNGEIVALKKVSVREDPEIGIPPFVMREVANLKRLSAPGERKDPHIVRSVAVYSSIVESCTSREVRYK